MHFWRFGIPGLCRGTGRLQSSGKKKQHKHKLLGPDFPRTRPLRLDAQGSKSFSPPPGPQENALFGADVHDFWRGRPRFLARSPRPEGLLKKFVQKSLRWFFGPYFRLFGILGLCHWPTTSQLWHPKAPVLPLQDECYLGSTGRRNLIHVDIHRARRQCLHPQHIRVRLPNSDPYRGIHP